MKKTISKILLVLVLSVPFIVKADMGAPMIRDYEAVITTDRTISCKKSGGNKSVQIGKGSIVKVYGTLDEDSIDRMFFTTDGEYECDVKDGEFKPVNEEVLPTTENSYDTKTYTKIEVIGDSVSIRKGPDEAYDEVASVPKGTFLKYRYVIEDEGQGAHSYAYVEYKGAKGWVNLIFSVTEYVENTWRKFIAAADTKTKCGTIPRNTVLSVIKTTGIRTYILFYNNCEFTYDYEMPLVEFDSEYGYGLLTKDAKIYEYADTTSSVLGKMDKGSKIEDYAHAEYYESGTNEKRYFYVKYKDVTGWILVTDGMLDDTYYEETTSTTTAANQETTKKAKEKKTKKKNNNIVIICSIVAVALALTATVVIIIINKKRKNKKVDKVEEVKTEEVKEETDSVESTEETKETSTNEETVDTEETPEEETVETEPEEEKEDTE